jgi:O-antigen ligase
VVQPRHTSRTPRDKARVLLVIGAGMALGVTGAVGGLGGLAVATVVVGPVAAAAGSAIGNASTAFGWGAFAFAACYGIVVAHSPDVTLFELVAIPPVAWLVFSNARTLTEDVRSDTLFRSFAFASIALIFLNMLFVVWHPAGLADSATKELGKNVEVISLSLAVYAFSSSAQRLGRAYALFALLVFVAAVEPVFSVHGDVLSVDSLMTDAPLLFLVLSIPFLSRLPVGLLAGTAIVVLCLARTRGGWIAGIVIALVVLVLGRLRALVGRAAVLGLLAAAAMVVIVVAALPQARHRFDSLASGRDQSLDTRKAMLHAAEYEAGKYPLTGVGPGEFKPYLLMHGSPIDFRIGLTAIPKDPHDVPAKFLAEMGIPGLIVILVWSASVLGAPWIAWRRNRASVRGADGTRWVFPDDDVRPYFIGLAFYAPIYGFLLIVSEWGSLTRIQLGFGAGLLLALLRFTRPDRAA